LYYIIIINHFCNNHSVLHKLIPGDTAECVKYAIAKNMPVDRCIYNIINNKLILG